MKSYENIKEGNSGLTAKEKKSPRITALTYRKLEEWKERCQEKGCLVPYFPTKAVSSVGLATKHAPSEKSIVPLEALSKLESGFLKALLFLPNVKKIVMQMPLDDIKKTVKIAEEKGIRHPAYKPKGNISKEHAVYQYTPMTTDVLMTYTDADKIKVRHAISLKCLNRNGRLGATDKKIDRINDKHEIERQYWLDKGVSWSLITSEHYLLGYYFQENLAEAYILGRREYPKQKLNKVKKEIIIIFEHRECITLLKLCELASQATEIETGLVRVMFWHLIWHNEISVDLHREIGSNHILYPKEGDVWS
ncbi:TnsA endonuclease N-terminal domain-containing protein [Pseudoalteromonas issachenkonii]|uniref:TnsA endonuclease N-terminal domain-containing protein n=1 Tax=Pseudoalteromonas issachenkonii TaxID=152297 RepID=A0ABU9H1C6_9GAMM|nr:TnsA endonuclease N-terminal domain-containing protein [Pseudoalteromonas distincta]MBD0410927.1 TnsA endonuclease N-terminal domain-containing protein [Pseudoalteromonas distincta]